MNPFQVVKDFEQGICAYTGAPYCVVTTSCTMALLLACLWHKRSETVFIPARTYAGVPQSILNAGYEVSFVDQPWTGGYQLVPLPIWDYARRFTSGMYVKGQMQCVSFHWTKILSIGQGGAILHDDHEADPWLRRARFDGRTEGVVASKDNITQVGFHAYMSPRDAAEGLTRLSVLPRHNSDLPNSDYPDLRQTFHVPA